MRFTLNLWICTVHFNLEIGATLFLQGPPLSGRLHVNFWLMGFDVDFGVVQDYSNTGLSLEDFFRLVLQSGLPLAASSHANDSVPPAHVFSCNFGLVPSGSHQTTPNITTWAVRAGTFQFSIACKFAINGAKIITCDFDSSKLATHVQPVISDSTHIHARPMKQMDEIHSWLDVSIRPLAPNANRLEVQEPTGRPPPWTEASLIIKSVPAALWGDCKLVPHVIFETLCSRYSRRSGG